MKTSSIIIVLTAARSGLPIIGNDFYEMLSDLQNVMDTYYELNESSERWNSAQVIVQYLSQRKLDDVRGNISQALGLLAWSEQPNVLWDAGYLEAFVHCVGMMTQATMKTRDYRNLTAILCGTRTKNVQVGNGKWCRRDYELAGLKLMALASQSRTCLLGSTLARSTIIYLIRMHFFRYQEHPVRSSVQQGRIY